jgi:hypothetical protein
MDWGDIDRWSNAEGAWREGRDEVVSLFVSLSADRVAELCIQVLQWRIPGWSVTCKLHPRVERAGLGSHGSVVKALFQ